MTNLYANFRNDAREYAQSRELWQRVLEEAARRLRQDGEWRPWVEREFADGSPVDREFLPMLDAKSESLGRALQVLQDPPFDDEVRVAAWVDYVGEGDTAFPELVISCVLSTAALEVAGRLIEQWMDPTMTAESMNERIDQALPPSG